MRKWVCHKETEAHFTVQPATFIWMQIHILRGRTKFTSQKMGLDQEGIGGSQNDWIRFSDKGNHTQWIPGSPRL